MFPLLAIGLNTAGNMLNAYNMGKRRSEAFRHQQAMSLIQRTNIEAYSLLANAKRTNAEVHQLASQHVMMAAYGRSSGGSGENLINSSLHSYFSDLGDIKNQTNDKLVQNYIQYSQAQANKRIAERETFFSVLGNLAGGLDAGVTLLEENSKSE